uniref:Semaphorin-5A n=1 Tax=Magallana gigas TaxID=29159 RepID=K1QJF6_MAGGI
MMDVPSKINDRQKREDIAFEEEDFNPNGGYGHWSKWSPCNRSCGFGEASRSRKCHDVTRCHGGNVELKLCFERKYSSNSIKYPFDLFPIMHASIKVLASGY